MQYLIFGCGDVGRRIAQQLIDSGICRQDITGFVNASVAQAQSLGIKVEQFDIDAPLSSLATYQRACCFYTIAPQKHGLTDLRSRALIAALEQQAINIKRAVLISTTGVYGDCDSEWVTEDSQTKAQTERAQRRLDSEHQWQQWGTHQKVETVILRVPGIYAHSRLPRSRIEKAIPVVAAHECGYTNRIHADDLAHVCIQAMREGRSGEIYNATDGTPGKISEYLQAAAQVLGLPKLPEISLQEAQQVLSSGMLSYLGESRKISNKKMLSELKVNLRYVDFREGLKHG